MTHTTSRRLNGRTKWILAAAFAAALILAPLTVAADDGEKPDRAGRRDKAAERAARPGWDAFEFKLNGTATGRDNQTYTLELDAVGLARFRLDENESFKRLHGFARVHGKVFDENGTLVKEGSFRAQLHIRTSDDGTLKWQLVETSFRPDIVRLHLRGNASASTDAGLELDGDGFARIKGLEPDARSTRLKVEVEGALKRL